MNILPAAARILTGRDAVSLGLSKSSTGDEEVTTFISFTCSRIGEVLLKELRSATHVSPDKLYAGVKKHCFGDSLGRVYLVVWVDYLDRGPSALVDVLLLMAVCGGRPKKVPIMR